MPRACVRPLYWNIDTESNWLTSWSHTRSGQPGITTIDFVGSNEIIHIGRPASPPPGQGMGTIRDDDAAPVLSINDVTVNEGNSGTSPAARARSARTRSDAAAPFGNGQLLPRGILREPKSALSSVQVLILTRFQEERDRQTLADLQTVDLGSRFAARYANIRLENIVLGAVDKVAALSAAEKAAASAAFWS